MFSASKTGAGASGYPIVNSLRFQSASSQYLNRTPASAGNLKTWTWSGWVKRGQLSSSASFCLFSSYTNDSNRFAVTYLNDTLRVENVVGGSAVSELRGTPVFRDPSAWYHVVIIADTTNATASNRYQIYVNNVLQTAFVLATYPALNADLQLNGAYAHNIGRQLFSTPLANFDGYMTEVNFIDGQALTPSSFGATDTTTGQWIAKSYSGSYGTNGFFLKFANGTSTTTLGADSSGNGNNWTLNNFTRSAGVSDCWMIDVPSGNSGASAVQPSSNYCTWNNLVYNAGGISFSNANLRLNYSSNIDRINIGNIATNTGKFYWEVTIAGLSSSSDFGIGICKQTLTNNTWIAFGGPNVIYYSTSSGWSVYGSNIGGATGSFSNGDVVGVSVDFDANVISIYQNNTLLTSRSGSIDTTIGHTVFGNSYRSGSTLNLNCGQRSFAYTPPSGFKALCTANLPAATILQGNKYMDATLYTGNATARSIVNAGAFAPSFVWGKCRSALDSHRLVDIVRGATKSLYSNLTNAEATESGVTAFNSNGFSLGTGAINDNGQTFVAWQWFAGTSTVTNTSGSISSQVRAGSLNGVSIVTWVGTATNSTVGHGLGIAPKMLIVKSYGVTDTWRVYHEAIGNTRFLNLNDNSGGGTASTVWNNTTPTSSVFSVGTESSVNGSGRAQVAYCFSEIAGFSRFGSYTGNGSTDGPFIYTNFQPKFIMIKRTDSTESWIIEDSVRDMYNCNSLWLYPNLTNTEGSGQQLDILSNGFKLRNVANGGNASGGSYIFMAFASNPFAQSNAR